MKVCAISDLHGYLPDIEECDVLTISGDIVPLQIQRNYVESENWYYTTFADWINKLPCDKVIIVAGNHDKYLAECPFPAINISEFTKGKCIYLQDKNYVYILGDKEYTIYGTPWCHKFGNWSFMKEDDSLSKVYKLIPENVDILLCHDTPDIGNLGLLPPSKWSPSWVNAGNFPLAESIKEKHPRYVFCGHLHECKDKYAKINNTEIYNVSLLDNAYKLAYKPIYLEI